MAGEPSLSDLDLHPESEQLEAYVEGTLDDGAHAVLESHLVACDRCRTELEEWRALFTALESLPALEPSPGFADRIMGRVAVAATPARTAAAVRWLPRSTKAWAGVAAVLALPVLGLGALVTWILVQPWATALNAEALAVWGWGRVAKGFGWVGGQAGALVMQSSVADAIGKALNQLMHVAGPAGLGLAAAAFCLAALASAWVLYHNLIRNSTRESSYAPYTI